MPLDGFKILDWAGLVFGGLPPIVLGGLAVAVLITGVTLMVVGARLVPASWGLIAAGGATAILTYFIVAAAIAGSGGNLQGGENVTGAAPRVVPLACSTIALGLAMFTGRMALRSWANEEASGKLSAVFLALVMFGLLFVGIQITRGSFLEIQREPPPGTETEDDGAAPEPIRRGVTAPRRR
jgi:hypothetical protein